MSNGRERSDLCGKNDGIESMIMYSARLAARWNS